MTNDEVFQPSGCVPRLIDMKFLPATILMLSIAAQSIVPVAAQKSAKTRALSEGQRIVHVLNRLGFGSRPGDVERVKAMGLKNYINQQLNPEKISDTVAENKLKDLTVLSLPTAELYAKYPQPGQLLRQLQARGMLPEGAEPPRNNQTPPTGNPVDNEKNREVIEKYYRENGLQRPQRIIAELQASRILRAVYSERQLQEVMVDFWTNHFNVFAGKGADRWLLPAYDRDTIRPHAMGKFSTLLQATAQSPAMLFYLDNFQSVSPNAVQRLRAPQQQRRGINENYARELMELHTLGVDGGYTQKDVQEVARCFTGWTIFQPRGGGAAVNAMLGEAGRRNAGTFFFNTRTHDDGEKVVLGRKISAGGGIKDGLTVLEILAHHPSTAKFIATKLVRHFVADNPPPALVERVAKTFTKSDGDIRETLKTIFFSDEFNSSAAYRAKIKRPFELVISAIRTLGADTNGGPGTHQWLARMGEPLYGFQTPKTILGGDISPATRETLLKQLDQSDPVTKVVGLILGTPEFQRQ
jgi:uncharacterized protein (DUF1800 family)